MQFSGDISSLNPKLLERFGMVDCNPKALPLDLDLNLSLSDCPDEINAEIQSQYRELIGSLLFLYQWTRLSSYFLIQISAQSWS